MTDTLNRLTSDFLTAATGFAPRLLGAAAVLLLALVVALALRRLAARFLRSVGLDDLFERTGASSFLWRVGYDGGPSRLLGLVLFWGVLLTGVAGALSALGLQSLESTMNALIGLAGRALVALAVLIGGVMAAGWLAELVAREAESAGLRGGNAFRRVVFAVVLTIACLVAAGQLGLETSILVLFALILFATAGLVTAIALGGGLIPLSGNIAAGRYVQEDINVGDEISVDGIEGTVEQIGYSAVVLRSEDGYLYRIPNRALLEGVVRKRV
ncbi:MAG: mechanosensitive ion channel family protein [Rubrobacter sp.]